MVVEPRFGAYKPSYDRVAKVADETSGELESAHGARVKVKDEDLSSGAIWSVRMANLQWLRDKFREKRERDQPGVPQRGAEKEFAESLGLNPTYLGHVWAGRRNIGNQVARQIEHAAHLPVGYLDHNQSTVMAPDADAREFVQQALDLFYADPNGARRMLLRAMHERIAGRLAPAPQRGEQKGDNVENDTES